MTATLTLLALLIGFSFSMAVSRYDQRKIYEEDEANAIGTEYLRADLLPPAVATNVRTRLIAYLDQRILFYETRDASQLQKINAETARLQSDLWTAVQVQAAKAPTPVMALAVSGMNDVLNAQGYTQAAWWNRIPRGAWVLMAAIAILANVLNGYGMHRKGTKGALLLIFRLFSPSHFFLYPILTVPVAASFVCIPKSSQPRAVIALTGFAPSPRRQNAEEQRPGSRGWNRSLPGEHDGLPCMCAETRLYNGGKTYRHAPRVRKRSPARQGAEGNRGNSQNVQPRERKKS